VDDDPLARLRGDASSNFGFSLGSADYDNDGAVDVFVGAPTAVNGSGDIAGAVFGFLGPLEGLLDPTDAAVRWDSTIPNTGLGRAIAVDGDLDGDKTPDVLMGASTPLGAAAIGCAYLQLGLASGSIDVASLDSFPAPSLDYTGYAVRFVRDWDGDDGSEVIIGSPLADTAPDRDVGAVHVFFSGGLLP
jgi:hypothetical protein